jgi:uncharacterized membrane protein YphA (DoxX/SURF4 family)
MTVVRGGTLERSRASVGAAWRLPARHGLFLLRIALGGFIAVNGSANFGRKLDAVVSRPEALFHSPVIEALGLPFPPPMIHLWGPLISVLGWLVALGLAWRAAALVAATVIVYVASCASGFGYFNHGTIVVPQMLLVLVVSPGADACSLDRLTRAIRRRARGAQGSTSLLDDWVGPATPPWGLTLAGGVLGLMYLAAGTSKLRYAPAEWLSGETLRAYLSEMGQQYWLGPALHTASAVTDPPVWAFSYVSPPTGYGQVVAAYPTLCMLLAVAAVATELLAPLGLVLTARYRALSCVSLLTFHFAISKLMGIPFRSWMVVLLALFPWPELWRAARVPLRRKIPYQSRH